MREAWKRENLSPAPRADDATFLRRAYVDIAGTVPPPDVTKAFLSDASPDKRQKLVDRLVASPAYADHWMNYWDDVLMGNTVKSPIVDRVAFRSWLRARFAANAPWDAIVRDLVAATGQNSSGGSVTNKIPGLAMAVPAPDGAGMRGANLPSDPSPMTSDGKGEDAKTSAEVNGAVNWTLRFEQSPQDLAGNASRIFLGVQIQCAQCHDHKFEKWKQDDFRRFASGFFHAKVEPLEGREKGAIRRALLVDTPRVPPRFAKNPELAPIARTKAAALDGTDVEKGEATRRALAAWITSKENPWFAKAIVNRMWGHFLGRGFYDPVDDVRPGNPPTMPELLDRIAVDFVAHGYDLAYLVRTIAATEAYNLASSADAKTDPENKLWARFHLSPLGPEELLNALVTATNVEETAKKAGIANFEQLRVAAVKQYAFLFDVDEEDDTPDFSGTITQALALLNGALVGQGSRALPGSTLADLPKDGSDADRIEALTLRVLARRPTADERTKWLAYVTGADRGREAPVTGVTTAPAAGASSKGNRGNKGASFERLGKKGKPVGPKEAAYEDLLWAMLNSSEFVFNH